MNARTMTVTCALAAATAIAALAADTKPLFGAADWLPSETDAVGFAGQGCNWYPGANPPAEFWEGTPTTVEVMQCDVHKGKSAPFDTKKIVPGYADAKSKNILWKNPVPGISTSSPIVIGKRVITLHSPHFIICWDSDTGKILWQDELKVMTLPKLAADRKSLEPAPDPEQAKKLQFLFEMAQSVYIIEQACQPSLRRSKLIGATLKPLVPYIQTVIVGLERVKPKVIENFPDAAVPLDKDIADAKKLVERITSAETEMKVKLLGAYNGLPPGFGVYMAGVTAHGNRLFILSQSRLYCIGPEVLGSPKDDPAIIAAIAAAKDAAELTRYIQAERPRYRRDALLRLATLKLSLNAEQKKQVQNLMLNDPFEEVRAAGVLALDVEKDAGSQQFLSAVIKAQKATKDKLTPSLLLTARELGAAYFQDRLPVALAANKDFVARQALFLIASNVRLFTPPVIEAAMETLKEPNFIIQRPALSHGPRQQNVADYLGLASAKDPRTLTALRKSGLNPDQLMPVLCHRLPVEELPSFIDELVRSGKDMGYQWNLGSQLNWFSRICYRMGAAKAIPVLETLKTDKPDMAEKFQGIIKGMTAK